MKNWKALSISWVDNMWKTSQIWLLSFGHHYSINVLKSLKGYHPGRKKFNLNESNERFRNGNEIQFLETLLYSVLKRNEDIASSKQSYDLTIVDRGLQAFVATIISTLAIKLWVNEANAEEYFYNWLVREGLDNKLSDIEDIKIILKCSTNVDEQIQTTMNRSENWDSPQERLRYIEYQKMLNEQISKKYNNNANQVYVSRPIIDIQNDIRAILSNNWLNKFEPIGSNINRLIGIGWMSEAGKSTIWEYLHNNGFVRTKIKYFAELINQLLPNASDLSPEEFATRLLLELHKFSNAHSHINNISIESIRDPKVFSFMKTLLGDRFQMLYVEASPDNTINRTVLEKNFSHEEAANEIIRKNKDKVASNAHEIKEIADSIICNDWSKEDLYKQINKSIFWPLNLSNLWLSNQYLQALETVSNKILSQEWKTIKYIGVAGSVWRNDVKADISDIDLVIVTANEVDHNRIKSTIRNDIRQINGIKIWLTLLDEDAITSDNPKQKTAYISRSIQIWNVKEIYNNGISFPAINENDLSALRIQNGKLYYQQTIRELDGEGTDINLECYKHIFTCMKIYLAALWFNVEGYENLYRYFFKISGINPSDYWIISMNEFVRIKPSIPKSAIIEFLLTLSEKTL